MYSYAGRHGRAADPPSRAPSRGSEICKVSSVVMLIGVEKEKWVKVIRAAKIKVE
jgi:hypothetical protein